MCSAPNEDTALSMVPTQAHICFVKTKNKTFRVAGLAVPGCEGLSTMDSHCFVPKSEYGMVARIVHTCSLTLSNYFGFVLSLEPE